MKSIIPQEVALKHQGPTYHVDPNRPKQEIKNGLVYGVTASIGSRLSMEDRHSVQIGLPKLPDWSFFAVFDGHGGSLVADTAARNLLTYILDQPHFRQMAEESGVSENPNVIEEAIHHAFAAFERELYETYHFARIGGSTAVCVLISPNYFYIINCGDSKAFLCRDWRIYFETSAHSLNNKRELERIAKAGGKIINERIRGLAMSRALGDFFLRDPHKFGNMADDDCIISDPDVTSIERDHDKDQFIVLASDGVFDVMDSIDVNSFIRREITANENVQGISNQLDDQCRSKGSYDNIDVVIIKFLPRQPQLQATASLDDKPTTTTNNKKDLINQPSV